MLRSLPVVGRPSAVVAGSGDLEQLAAEVGDELEGAAEGGDVAVQDVDTFMFAIRHTVIVSTRGWPSAGSLRSMTRRGRPDPGLQLVSSAASHPWPSRMSCRARRRSQATCVTSSTGAASVCSGP